MIKVHNVYIGNKYELSQLNDNWAVVHACKTSHQNKLGYTKPIKDSPYYIVFLDGNHLYLNWVDEPSGRFFQVDTFKTALDFIDEHIKDKDVFIHCDQGESRAPTLGMVYLAKRTNFLEDDFAQALTEFKQLYPSYNPSGIIKFVQQNWNDIN